MAQNEIPDYTEDWQLHWEFRYESNYRRRLQKAAEDPNSQFLPVKPSELNPSSEEYGWSVEIEHLREHPDIVLRDARAGFAQFVSENQITDEPENYYDILPVNFTENYFHLRDNFWESSRLAELKSNTVASISIELSGSVERSLSAAAISFECPNGHRTRIPQPIYTHRVIENCAKQDCTNSVYPISQDTEFQNIISFDVPFDNSEIKVVAAGLYAQDRVFEELQTEDNSLNIVGIPRNVIRADKSPERVFEALFIDI